MTYSSRIRSLHKIIEEQGLDGALVVNPENIYYFTGSPFVTGGIGKLLYLDKKGTDSLIVADIDYEEACKTATGVDLVKTEFGERPTERLKKLAGSTLGFEEDFVSFEFHKSLTKSFKLKPLKGAIGKLREVKEQDEVARIVQSQRTTERALEKASKSFREGLSELEIASEIEYHMRREGAVVYAYDSLVASGYRAVYPHGMPTDKKVGGGEAVVIDVGSKDSGYCSDMTRTFFFGKPDEEMVKIYKAVLGSQEAALEAARPSIRGKELDGVARKFLEEKGYAEYFVHGLGHGVGIAVHEGPNAGPRGESLLAPGNVITVEPGVYIPKLGGVRIEDMILITEKGASNLTNFTKELLIF